jgi:alpha-D-ribose 1-methylphosphonate 5-phosphate C-P lyase
VVSLDFEDHPFEVRKFTEPCALGGAEQVYLDEVRMANSMLSGSRWNSASMTAMSLAFSSSRPRQ